MTRLESFGHRLEAAKSVRFAMLADEARRAVQWGLRRGLLSYPENQDNNPNGDNDHDE